MSIRTNTTHNVSIQFVEETRKEVSRKGKGTAVTGHSCGFVTVTHDGVNIFTPREDDASRIYFGDSGSATVRPEHLDALIGALQEARVLGKHLFGGGK